MNKAKPRRYGMVIDLDRCAGCGACMVACAVENNVAPAHAGANPRTGITPVRVYRVNNGQRGAGRQSAFLPVLCMQCDNPPCEKVCPQQAVEVDKNTGIVAQMPQRCLGCRYCMTACPYHARYFNWWDPAWPAGMEVTLNPCVSTRSRGVVEKCNLCHARLHEADDQAVAAGKPAATSYQPVCAAACPTQAIAFGDLEDKQGQTARLAGEADSFRLLAKLGTGPKIWYRSRRPWVRALAERDNSAPSKGSSLAQDGHTPAAQEAPRG
jgi:molybdopterin-containing oxidoreductase family iron-sulfur binding subunit